jgi:hypothetical protein
MAETLGLLCDKLTIVKLKQWHSDDTVRLQSLDQQAAQLQQEIDEFIVLAVSGAIPADRLTFAANKVFKPDGNSVKPVGGTIGEAFCQLATVNCALWHEQENVYDFENVPHEKKNAVVKQLAVLNLQRNECIDRIDRSFKEMIRPTLVLDVAHKTDAERSR